LSRVLGELVVVGHVGLLEVAASQDDLDGGSVERKEEKGNNKGKKSRGQLGGPRDEGESTHSTDLSLTFFSSLKKALSISCLEMAPSCPV
jgi:hypothetical protein